MSWIKKLLALLLVLTVSSAVRAQSMEERSVEGAGEVLHEIMDIPAKAIPRTLLADAQGVLIIPDMVKGSFIVGARRGKGVVLARNADGAWTTPVFVTVTGGSIGFQIGIEATDVIAVFRTRAGVNRLLSGKFTLGVDANVAAGPIGRDAAAATDAQLKAEILSYSRSRGVFAGVAIDGAAIVVDRRATDSFYAPKFGQPPGSVPASAVKLVEQVAAYAEPEKKLASVKEVPTIPPPPIGDYREEVRAQLADSSLHLQKILDPKWREYLALPAELYAEGKAPRQDALAQCLNRYEAVSRDARYSSLTATSEFRQTQALLVRYRSALEGNKEDTLRLPPPPR
ncbi:MAG TPA: lipid-binding SYLF domain-containing protein [Gemmataceae bacterium]|nr:lipid-binding SYLF domain-containing protein [Gemmataceae bacterium]